MKYEIIKGNEKCFEGAPEWAMFLSKDKFGDLAWDEGEISASGLRYQWVDPENDRGVQKYAEGSIGVNLSGVIAERRPITEPVWDGEGLPPVGALCRYRAFSDMPWVECEVLGWYGDDAWMKRTEDGRTFVMGNPELFPIRSPEDVARDEAIEDMLSNMPVEECSMRDFVAAIYDDGYRKME